jgi:energy-coupling factor transporter transmembrane protein EcfT
MARMWRPGVVGRVGGLILAVAFVAFADGARLAVATLLCLAASAVWHPLGYRVLGRRAVWLFLLLLVLPPIAFTAPRTLELGALAVSGDGLALAATVLARAVVIAVAAAGFAATVSARALADMFEWCGLRGVGFALGVAIHALPRTTHIWTTSARALRLRGGFRAHRVRDLALLAMTVVGNALRHADEVVEAAQARGYAPGRRQVPPPDGWHRDLAWLGVWSSLAAFVLLGLR